MRHLPTQSRARERVQRILLSAEEMLNEGDVFALTTNALADRAGVPVGSIYQYFADRDQIIVALLDGFRDDIVAAYRAPRGDASLVDQLVTPVLTYGEAHFGVARVLMMPPAVPVLVATSERVRHDILMEWLRIIRAHRPDLSQPQAALAADVTLAATTALTARGAVAKQAVLDTGGDYAAAHEAASRVIRQVYPLLNGYFAHLVDADAAPAMWPHRSAPG
jgi:AcrR family transcriptional regulator